MGRINEQNKISNSEYKIISERNQIIAEKMKLVPYKPINSSEIVLKIFSFLDTKTLFKDMIAVNKDFSKYATTVIRIRLLPLLNIYNKYINETKISKELKIEEDKAKKNEIWAFNKGPDSYTKVSETDLSLGKNMKFDSSSKQSFGQLVVKEIENIVVKETENNHSQFNIFPFGTKHILFERGDNWKKKTTSSVFNHFDTKQLRSWNTEEERTIYLLAKHLLRNIYLNISQETKINENLEVILPENLLSEDGKFMNKKFAWNPKCQNIVEQYQGTQIDISENGLVTLDSIKDINERQTLVLIKTEKNTFQIETLGAYHSGDDQECIKGWMVGRTIKAEKEIYIIPKDTIKELICKQQRLELHVLKKLDRLGLVVNVWCDQKLMGNTAYKTLSKRILGSEFKNIEGLPEYSLSQNHSFENEELVGVSIANNQFLYGQIKEKTKDGYIVKIKSLIEKKFIPGEIYKLPKKFIEELFNKKSLKEIIESSDYKKMCKKMANKECKDISGKNYYSLSQSNTFEAGELAVIQTSVQSRFNNQQDKFQYITIFQSHGKNDYDYILDLTLQSGSSKTIYKISEEKVQQLLK